MQDRWFKPTPAPRQASRDVPGLVIPPNSVHAFDVSNHASQKPETQTPSTATATPTATELLTPASKSKPNDYFADGWNGRIPVSQNPKNDVKRPAPTSYSTTHIYVTRDNDSNIQIMSGRANTSPIGQARSSPNRQLGHWRHHDKQSGNDTGATIPGSSISSTKSGRSRAPGHRSPTQKTMLAEALSKANTAVLLDNAQNLGGAVHAYGEACQLLQQVMLRSSDPDDREKLSTIHTTYAKRIDELNDIVANLHFVNSSERPDELTKEHSLTFGEGTYYEEDTPNAISRQSQVIHAITIPPRLESMLPMTTEDNGYDIKARLPRSDSQAANDYSLKPPFLSDSVDSDYIPSPLSPRKVPRDGEDGDSWISRNRNRAHQNEPTTQHGRDGSNESTSWLDTVDESASSASSSRFSSLDIRPPISSYLADEFEAEFDAAMNAAVDSAYSTAPDPNLANEERNDARGTSSGVLTHPPVDVEPTAETHTHQAFQSQATQATKVVDGGDQRSQITTQILAVELDEEADEEERLLEEVTRGFNFDDFHFDKHSKSALPRQSDSSGFSGRTWGSSTASTTLTSGTTLSTLAEATETAPKPKLAPALPPPSASLPPLPLSTHDVSAGAPPGFPAAIPPSGSPSLETQLGTGVRDRRMSGQNAKQLKIETYNRTNTVATSSKSQFSFTSAPRLHVDAITEEPKSAPTTFLPPFSAGPSTTNTALIQPLTPLTSTYSVDSGQSESPATPALTQAGSQASIDETVPRPPSPLNTTGKIIPTFPPPIPKSASSPSLKVRHLSVTTDEMADSSPLSPNLLPEPKKTLPTPISASHTPTASSFMGAGFTAGGLSLFDDHIGHTMASGPSHLSSVADTDAPLPLEPCPDSYLLRPFWLMRCLYQTLAHPRGGYISTKLFLPRDIWRVKNVKLKLVEDKISQCDLLTAALLRLAQVDTLDADAVLEELQAFESVLEQVRVTLQKKLGNEVGLSGSTSVFKVSPVENSSDPFGTKSAGSAAKSLASSWRKLRSKSSGAAMTSSHSAPKTKDDGSSTRAFTMASIPMTTSSQPELVRHAARRPAPMTANFSSLGAFAHYVSSLARLFDAAQVLDQIARQVEDPGLKCSNKTQVGLEIGVRNAAEFFAFYVLRFVLGDVGTLVDKFIKRGTEWVLA